MKHVANGCLIMQINENAKALLVEFYKEFSLWVETGKGNFDKECGICDNLTEWALAKGFPSYPFRYLLKESFIDAGLDYRYPFNEGSHANYVEDHDMYNNPLRVQWIHDHAK